MNIKCPHPNLGHIYLYIREREREREVCIGIYLYLFNIFILFSVNKYVNTGDPF